MNWQPELDELRRREALAREMGGADKVKRQHEGGRLTVRERIDRLADKDSFREIGAASERGGTVKSILVKPDEMVEEGQVVAIVES